MGNRDKRGGGSLRQQTAGHLGEILGYGTGLSIDTIAQKYLDEIRQDDADDRYAVMNGTSRTFATNQPQAQDRSEPSVPVDSKGCQARQVSSVPSLRNGMKKNRRKEQKETLSIIMKAYDKAMIERAAKMKDFLTLMPEEQTERQNEFQSLSEWIARYHASKKQWENHA